MVARLSTRQELQDQLERLYRELLIELDGVVHDEAEGLADAMKVAVPVGSGKLRESIRVEKGLPRGVQSAQYPLTYLVRAGGKLTTTPDGYDYAIATEFGTTKEHAEPFFWTTYRARRDQIRDRIKAATRNGLARAVSMRGARTSD